MWPTQAGNAALVGTRSGVSLKELDWSLLGDLVRALPGGVLRGLDLLAALAGEDADEATDGVLLPARSCYDLSQRRTLGALHHRDHVGLLVGTLGVGFAGRLLRLARFLRGLGFLGGGAPALRLRNACIRRFLGVACIGAHSVSPGPGCGRHIDHSGSEKLQ